MCVSGKEEVGFLLTFRAGRSTDHLAMWFPNSWSSWSVCTSTGSFSKQQLRPGCLELEGKWLQKHRAGCS